MESYRVFEIDKCAAGRAGVYAWYWTPRLSEADVRKYSASPDGGAQYFYSRVAEPMKLADYDVSLRGPLLPSYSGKVQHSHISLSRVQEFFEAFPNALEYLSSVFPSLAPWFVAPLYIGVASDLARRLREHRELLYRYAERGAGEAHGSFAAAVARANIDPDELVVHCLPLEEHRLRLSTDERTRITELGEKADCVFVEHILNRWSHPIFGGN